MKIFFRVRIAISDLARALAWTMAETLLRRAWILVREDCSFETIKAFSALWETIGSDQKKLRAEVLKHRKRGAWENG